MELRERVLRAALDCFIEVGYDRASIARIRERSGVSNGALFHHFPNKEAIAETLYLEAMRSIQADYWAVLQAEPTTLRDAVDGIVRQQLTWVESNPRWAQFLYARGHLDWSTAAGGELRELNRDLSAAYREFLARFIATGEVRDLPMTAVVAIVTGPAHAIAQRWLAGQIQGLVINYADDLIDAAVAGLSGKPTQSRRPTRPLPTQARVHLQLATDRGVVLYEGQQCVDLAPPSSESGNGPPRVRQE